MFIGQVVLRLFCLYISWYYGGPVYRSVDPRVVLFIDQLVLMWFCL